LILLDLNDTVRGFNMDWNAQCGHLNLARTRDQKQKNTKTKKLKETKSQFTLCSFRKSSPEGTRKTIY